MRMPLQAPPRATPTIDRRSGLHPVIIPPRHDPLYLLARYRIDVDGERFPVSAPQRGDATRAEDKSWHWSFGLEAADVPRLVELGGRTARLLDRDGQALLALRIERVDRRFAMLIADPRPARR